MGRHMWLESGFDGDLHFVRYCAICGQERRWNGNGGPQGGMVDEYRQRGEFEWVAAKRVPPCPGEPPKRQEVSDG